MVSVLIASCDNKPVATKTIPKSNKPDPVVNLQTPPEKEAPPPLHSAALEDRLEDVNALLAEGVDVNSFDASGYSALMLAAEKNNLDVVKHLISHGADLEARNPMGQTSLMLAIFPQNLFIVKVLLANEADVNAKDKLERTALVFAVEVRNIDITRELVALGADPNASDNNGYPMLVSALRYAQREISELLVEYGAEVNFVDKHGETPLMVAAQRGYTDAANAMLLRGADVNAVDKSSGTALMHAAAQGSSEVLKALLAHGAEVNKQNKYGETALINAANARRGKTEDVEALLAYGAVIDIKSKRGLTAKDYATKRGEVKIINLLEEAETKPRPAPPALKKADIQVKKPLPKRTTPFQDSLFENVFLVRPPEWRNCDPKVDAEAILIIRRDSDINSINDGDEFFIINHEGKIVKSILTRIIKDCEFSFNLHGVPLGFLQASEAIKWETEFDALLAIKDRRPSPNEIGSVTFKEKESVSKDFLDYIKQKIPPKEEFSVVKFASIFPPGSKTTYALARVTHFDPVNYETAGDKALASMGFLFSIGRKGRSLLLEGRDIPSILNITDLNQDGIFEVLAILGGMYSASYEMLLFDEEKFSDAKKTLYQWAD